MRNARLLLLAGTLTLAACGSDGSDESAPTSTPSTTISTPPAPTTAPTTAAPTTVETTSMPATDPVTVPTTGPPTTACSFAGGVDPVAVDFPMKMSSLVGTDIRTGVHDCYERVVIEFAGTGELPGYRVQYVPDAEVTDSPRGEFVAVAGDATLVISAASWMPDMEGNGYDGPMQFVPDDTQVIRELVQLENFEGMFQWAIGLDGQRPFTVDTLTDPTRLVVDVATG